MIRKHVNLKIEDGVATITLDYPEKLNALGMAIVKELTTAIAEVATDDEVKAVILTGAGRSFCSGADLTGEQNPLVPKERYYKIEPLAMYGNLFLNIRNLPKPIIGAINGIAAGAGFSLAMCCDIRIASENAEFSSIFVRVGTVPDTGLSYLLPRAIGTSKALELMFTGDFIDAHEANDIGIVSEVVPADELLNTAKTLANRIARGPSIAIELTKKAVYAAERTNDFASVLSYEAWAFGVCRDSEDLIEGAIAFREKREPHFKGK